MTASYLPIFPVLPPVLVVFLPCIHPQLEACLLSNPDHTFSQSQTLKLYRRLGDRFDCRYFAISCRLSAGSPPLPAVFAAIFPGFPPVFPGSPLPLLPPFFLPQRRQSIHFFLPCQFTILYALAFPHSPLIDFIAYLMYNGCWSSARTRAGNRGSMWDVPSQQGEVHQCRREWRVQKSSPKRLCGQWDRGYSTKAPIH